jgi:hypothetical protein
MVILRHKVSFAFSIDNRLAASYKKQDPNQRTSSLHFRRSRTSTGIVQGRLPSGSHGDIHDVWRISAEGSPLDRSKEIPGDRRNLEETTFLCRERCDVIQEKRPRAISRQATRFSDGRLQGPRPISTRALPDDKTTQSQEPGRTGGERTRKGRIRPWSGMGGGR